jgi:excisionase family DNA binding protein
MQTTSNDDRLTIEQAAPILGIAVSSLRQLIYTQQIKFMRIGPNGGRYRFKRIWLDEYLESCEVSPATDVQRAVQPQAKIVASPRNPRRAKAVPATDSVVSFKDELKVFKQQMKKRGTA